MTPRAVLVLLLAGAGAPAAAPRQSPIAAALQRSLEASAQVQAERLRLPHPLWRSPREWKRAHELDEIQRALEKRQNALRKGRNAMDHSTR
jgi:hypothetical protein